MDENIPPQGTALSAGNPNIGKNKGALYGCPGRRLFANLTAIDAAATPVRAVYTAGGRLFVAAGTKYMELNAAGGLVGSVRTIADDAAHSPVQFAVNGTQLFIVSAGLAYIDNGAGPVLISFPGVTYSDLGIGYTGTVSTLGFAVSVFTGSLFNEGMQGQSITINGVGYTVGTVYSPQTLSLTTSAGIQSGVTYTQGANTTLNSTLTPFHHNDVGSSLNVTGGTGFTLQTVTILSVDGFGNATCSAALGTVGSTGGSAVQSFTFGAVTGTFLDSYFIVNKPNSTQYYISAINDGTVWHASDVGVKESNPDYIRSVMAHNEQLYLWGTATFEVAQTDKSGTATFPFQRIDAGGKYGSISAWGPIALDGRIFFLGGNTEGQVVAYVLDGFTPRRISTHAEESQWNLLGAATNVISYCYTEEGHSFWVFSISGQTWHYDTTTGAWGQRYSWDGANYTAYHTNYHAYIAEFGSGKHITGGSLDTRNGGANNGNLYESSINIYNDAGADIKWQRALPPLYNEGKQIYLGRVDLEMETGTGSAIPPSTITLDWSHDRGHTFVNAETASIGIAGAYSQRVYWINNGSGRYPIPRFSGSGQYKVALIDADIEMALGAN